MRPAACSVCAGTLAWHPPPPAPAPWPPPPAQRAPSRAAAYLDGLQLVGRNALQGDALHGHKLARVTTEAFEHGAIPALADLLAQVLRRWAHQRSACMLARCQSSTRHGGASTHIFAELDHRPFSPCFPLPPRSRSVRQIIHLRARVAERPSSPFAAGECGRLVLAVVLPHTALQAVAACVAAGCSGCCAGARHASAVLHEAAWVRSAGVAERVGLCQSGGGI